MNTEILDEILVKTVLIIQAIIAIFILFIGFILYCMFTAPYLQLTPKFFVKLLLLFIILIIIYGILYYFTNVKYFNL